MKVLLINQSNGIAYNENPPLGCLYLAAAVRDRGHEIDVYDQGAMENHLQYPSQRILEEFHPDVVGLSLYTFGLPQAFEYVQWMKQKYPEIVIVAGGHHATALPVRTLQDCHGIDYLVYGEGETTFGEFLDALEKNGRMEDIQGLYFRRPEIVHTAPRPLIEDLDGVTFPANDLIEKYSYPSENIRIGNKVLNIIASRGCPFHCTYCNKAVHGSSYRVRSPESVIAEIEHMFHAFGYDEVMFHDELFGASKDWLDGFLGLIHQRGLRLPWRSVCRVGTVDSDDFVRMRKAGCYIVAFGLEAGNETVRHDLNRKMSNEEILSSFRMARKAGLVCYAFNMINHRLDTFETVQDTYRLMKRVGAEFSPVFICSPLPGSQIHQELPEALRYNWELFNSYRDFRAVPIPIGFIEAKELLVLASQMEAFYYASLSYLFRHVLAGRIPMRIRKSLFRLWAASTILKEKHLSEDEIRIDGRRHGIIARRVHGWIYRTMRGGATLIKRAIGK